MKKEILGLIGIIGLSGCTGKAVNSPAPKKDDNTLIGVATSDSLCITIRPYVPASSPSSRLEFDFVYKKGEVSHDVHVIYTRQDWERCFGFPKIFRDDAVKVAGGERDGNSIYVRYPEGVVRNVFSDSRWGI